MASFYVTTPIYYVNDVPHLGTAYTTIIADAIRRFHLLIGDETRMLTGTDEHGLKIERQAIERGVTPKAFVDEMSAPFRTAWPLLGVEADDFIRTTEERHESWVQDLWRTIEKNGDLYEGEYEDWYCVGCESFKTEKELLPGNICPLHMKPVERVKEKTFFFRLSKYEKPLLELFERRPDLIEPASRRNEVISFVSSGLRDLSVSRTSFKWGIPVPDHPGHVMYVWFDALSNYISALGNGENRAKFWPPKGKVLHLVGKDILRFHTVYWPAFLLAAGYREDELPNQVYAHGFLTIDGQKMSKSLRNAVDPIRLAKELGTDVLRYHLLRAVAFGQDGDFDHAALLERYNADLGKNLGNLLARTLGLCVKMTDSKTPSIGVRGPLEQDLVQVIEASIVSARTAWLETAPHRALEATWAISSAANQYVDKAAPWAAAKSGDTTRVATILATLLEALRIISVMIWPAMPTKSDALRAQLGLSPLVVKVGDDLWPVKFAPRPAGEALAPSTPLFPTLDEDQRKALLDRLMPKPEPQEPSMEEAVPATSGVPTTRLTVQAPAEPPPPRTSQSINYDQFAAIELKAGVILTCVKVPKKDKLLQLSVDVGEESPRTIIAGLALSFAPEALVGRRVVVVANLMPRDFGKGLVSHGMLLATGPSEALHLATVEGDVPPGARLK
jgi:methionyl-tRNA synthetase